MTWTYTSDPAGVPRDQVRYLLGDIDAADPKVSDEEIAYALAATSNNAKRAAALAADALATRYEQTDGVVVPGVSVDWTGRAAALRALARRLRAEANGMDPDGPSAPMVAPVLEGADPDTLDAGRMDEKRQPLMMETDRASLGLLDEEIGLRRGPYWEPDPA